MNKDIKSVTIYDPPYNDQPVAIYVHGLASGANAATGKALSKRFNNFNWITTDFGEDLAANVRQLNECIKEHKPQLIIGTSMGGLTLLYADAPDAAKTPTMNCWVMRLQSWRKRLLATAVTR